MKEEHTLFERIMLIGIGLALIGLFVFRKTDWRPVFDYSISGFIILNMISKTIRFWSLADNRDKLFLSMSILLVMVSIGIYEWEKGLIVLVPFIAGVLVFNSAFISLYKTYSYQKKQDR